MLNQSMVVIEKIVVDDDKMSIDTIDVDLLVVVAVFDLTVGIEDIVAEVDILEDMTIDDIVVVEMFLVDRIVVD